jgi:hypothetical protein
MLHIVINPLLCYRHLCPGSQRRTSIQVPIELWKGTGADFQADTMTCLEGLRRIPAINVDEIRSSSVLGIPLEVTPENAAKGGVRRPF